MTQPPNPSGRTMLDGETSITDLDRTEANREMVSKFARQVLVGRKADLLENFIAEAQNQSPHTFAQEIYKHAHLAG